MTKQELALSSYAQRISLGYLTVDIGDRLSFGQDAHSLIEKLRRVRQLHKLFDYEYGLADNGDINTLQKIVFLVNTYLNNYRLNGTYVVAETEITPVPYKYAHIVIIGGSGGGGGDSNLTEFKYIYDVNGVLVVDGTMRKTVISHDISVDATNQNPGMFGVLIVRVNDIGGWKYTFAAGNYGTPILNTLPRAETRLYWERYDNGVYWKSEVISPGISPTTVPEFAIDDIRNILDIFHQLGYSEILISTNGGPWEQFEGPINIGEVDRPEGYWRAKVKGLEPDRIESPISYSPATSSVRKGFTYIFDFNLT